MAYVILQHGVEAAGRAAHQEVESSVLLLDWKKKGIMPRRQDDGTVRGRRPILSIENVHKLNAANMMTPGLAIGSDATK